MPSKKKPATKEVETRKVVDVDIDVVTCVRPDEIDAIATLAERFDPKGGILVEIGTWRGGSARRLARRLSNWAITTIDNYARRAGNPPEKRR